METIFILLILAAAVFFLIYTIRKQASAHDCDDCGLMEMKRTKDRNEQSKN